MGDSHKSSFFALELLPGEAFEVPLVWFGGQQASIPISESLLNRPHRSIPREDVVLLGRRLKDRREFPVVWRENGETRCSIDLPEWITMMQQELYRPEHTMPVTARLPFHYHILPGIVRNILAFVVLRAKKASENALYPLSPLNPGCEILLAASGKREGSPHSVAVLTHDIDTKHGIPWISRIAETEEEHGFRSSWNVVPKSYPLDGEIRQVLHDLKARGHEVGLHGIWHNNKEAFLGKEALSRELDDLKPLINEFEITGYRGPSWYRTHTMFDVLEKFFEYDTSCLDNDFNCPGGSGGVGVMRPFRIRENLMEIPCTLAFDALLLLGHSPKSLFSYWLPKIKWMRKMGGYLVVNTHPDPNYTGNEQMLEVYEALLVHMNREGWQPRLPGEIARDFRI